MPSKFHIMNVCFFKYKKLTVLILPKKGEVWLGLVSLFNGISAFEGYLMPKLSFWIKSDISKELIQK